MSNMFCVHVCVFVWQPLMRQRVQAPVRMGRQSSTRNSPSYRKSATASAGGGDAGGCGREEDAGATLIDVSAGGGAGGSGGGGGSSTRAGWRCCCRRVPQTAVPVGADDDGDAAATPMVPTSSMQIEEGEEGGVTAAFATQRALAWLAVVGVVLLATAGAVAAAADNSGASTPTLVAAWRWLVVVACFPLSLAGSGGVVRGALAVMEMPAAPHVEAIYMSRCVRASALCVRCVRACAWGGQVGEQSCPLVVQVAAWVGAIRGRRWDHARCLASTRPAVRARGALLRCCSTYNRPRPPAIVVLTFFPRAA